LGLILIFSLIGSSATVAKDGSAFVRQVRVIETDVLGLRNPAGLVFSPEANAFHVAEARKPTQPPTPFSDIMMITPTEDLAGSARIAAAITDPINMAFDGKARRLLIFQSTANKLIEVTVGPDGKLDPTMLVRHDARHFGLQNPQGMAVDPVSGHLFVLDVSGPRIVRIEPQPDGGLDSVQVTQVDLQPTGLVDPRGLAFDPANGHFHLLSLDEQKLYELTDTGQVVATRDVSAFELNAPEAMVLAPSGDLTDDPLEMSLYLADSGQVEEVSSLEGSSEGGESNKGGQEPGKIIELSFAQPATLEASTYEALLVQTIDTSLFSPPSPDPAGIAFLNSSNTLLISDSEVNEMFIFTGDNLFEVTLSGNLLHSLTTIPFSNEPCGVGYNPGNGHVFFSDDDADEVFEMDPGADGLHGTADDI
jgi:DNA-binding beta-propeller fold protein YncE